jgi:hypothetical protein
MTRSVQTRLIQRVLSGSQREPIGCPLYPNEQTSSGKLAMSEKCQDRKSLFDHIVCVSVLNNKALCPNGLNSFCLGFGVFC